MLHILCSMMFGIKYVHLSHVYSHLSLELATLTSSVDLQLMDGYVHSLFTGRVNVK